MIEGNVLFSNKKYGKKDREIAKEKSKVVIERFNKWIVSFKYLLAQGEVDELFSDQSAAADSVIMHEEERVSKYQRLLLEVERTSVLRKKSELAKKQVLNHKIVLDLIDKHEENLNEFIATKEINELIKFPKSFDEFISYAYTESININKIYETVRKDTSLSESIISLVNNPSFCDSINKQVKNISDIKTAIGFIGIDRCKLLIPVLMMKPLLRWNDQNIKLIVPKVWQYSILTANASRKRLLDSGYKNPDEAFAIGIIRNIGHFIILNYFSQTFEKTMEEMITYYRDNGMREEYYACADITPKLRFLPKMFFELSDSLTRRIVEKIEWGHKTHLRHALLEDIDNVPVTERSVHGVALMQGRYYSIFNLMNASKVFQKPYATVFFADCLLSKNDQREISESNPGILNK